MICCTIFVLAFLDLCNVMLKSKKINDPVDSNALNNGLFFLDTGIDFIKELSFVSLVLSFAS